MLERPCPECGFDASALPPERVPELVRANAAAWRQVLSRPRRRADGPAQRRPVVGPGVRLPRARRPPPLRRAAGAHAHRGRPRLRQLGPGRDRGRRPLQRAGPRDVAAAIDEAAGPIADRFASVEGDAWQRTGNRSDGATFTVDTFARYFVHDPVHHLDDVAKGFAALGVAETTPMGDLAVDTALEPVATPGDRAGDGPRAPRASGGATRAPCRPTGRSGGRTAATSRPWRSGPRAWRRAGPGRRASWPTSSGWPPSTTSTWTSPCCAPRGSPRRPG